MFALPDAPWRDAITKGTFTPTAAVETSMRGIPADVQENTMRKAFCWFAYHLIVTCHLPITTRLAWWLLPFAGEHAF